MKRKILFTALITALLTGLAFSVGAEETSDTAAQPVEQDTLGQPEIAGDGIQNPTQVDDPADIGHSGLSTTDTPEPLPVEGGAGVQEAK